MRTKNKFWLFVGVATFALVLALGAIAFLFWNQLAVNQQNLIQKLIVQHFAYFFSAGVLLLAAFGFTIDWFFRFYVLPARQLVEQLQLLCTVNPDLEIDLEGSHDLVWIARKINAMRAEQSRVNNGRNEPEKEKITQEMLEKRILETILDQHPSGVVICNLDGGIVFYNNNAKRLLSIVCTGSENPMNMSLVGLGRSLYNFIDQLCLDNALERIRTKIANQAPDPVEFILVGSGPEGMIQAEIIAIVDFHGRFAGYILLLNNIRPEIDKRKNDAKQLKELIGSLSDAASVASLSASMVVGENRSNSLKTNLENMMLQLNNIIKKAKGKMKDFPEHLHRLTPKCIGEWASELVAELKIKAGVDIDLELIDENQWIKVDSCSLNTGLINILSFFYGPSLTDLKCQIDGQEYICVIDFISKGVEPLDRWYELVKLLKDESVASEKFLGQMSVGAILEYHTAEVFPIVRGNNEVKGLRIILPTEASSSFDSCTYENHKITVLPESRPVFYDFDLFSQPGQTPEIDNRLLTELVYTVFDTETTGLNPREGDEIISIGAVRIVNGRLLVEEKFDQLIDPCRHLPWESIRFHGIRPEMLDGMPTIKQVLPEFHRFVKDTVLVAHNAAFDMRMLQVKEEETGVKFINPVLDTMHLSAVVHPAQTSHRLGDIAGRLGVKIKGRHTAFGDAMATAQIFLKLIPLLEEKGITTLKEARLASQKTYYARLKY